MWPARLAHPLIVTFALLAVASPPRRTLASQPETGQAAKITQVIVVFKTHFDIGYTDLARNVIERYRTSMIDQALDVCDAAGKLPPEHRFVWTLSGFPMTQILWLGQTPERRERVEQAIRSGRLVWHALPGSLHTESLDLEDLVRGLGSSSRLARQFGQPLPRDAKMTDVASHTWLMPTLLKHAGVDFFHIGCNSGSSSPDLPRLFWWEGPDGSRLLTMYEATGYGSALKPPDDWPYRTWLALIHSGDNQGPPAAAAVTSLLDRARRDLPGVQVRLGRLSDFGDAIFAEHPKLPVVRADLPDTWIHGIMSMPIETKIARNARLQIAALEALNANLAGWGVDVRPVKPTVAQAYEQSLLYGEHTWGASSKFYSPRLYGKAWEEAWKEGKYAFAEESWREHGAWARNTESLTTPALATNLAALAGAVNVGGPRIVVYNPLPWKRSDVVLLKASTTAIAALKDAASGEPVAIERHGETLRFLAADVPPLGYRTYVPATTAPRETRLADSAARETLANGTFTVSLDVGRGAVRSIVSKRSGRELVDRQSPYALGQYLYERFNGDINQAYVTSYRKTKAAWMDHFGKVGLPPASQAPYLAASPGDFRLERLGGPVAIGAQLVAQPNQKIPHDVTLAVRLYENQPYLDLEWTITAKKPDPWAEAGWLCLPLAVAQPTFRLGRVGSIIDPATDIRPGANHDVFCLSSGLTVTDAAGQGLGIATIDAPLVSLGEPGLFRYTRLFTPRQPIVFVNLFNNVWGTNFQQWTLGSWTARVRLWETAGRGAETDLITPAWEARVPCQAVFVDQPAGALPGAQPGLELSRRGVLVTAFGPNPDGDGLLLRLWEQAGCDGICQVHLPGWLHATQAQPCDLRGQVRGPAISLRAGGFDADIKHFAPASFLLN